METFLPYGWKTFHSVSVSKKGFLMKKFVLPTLLFLLLSFQIASAADGRKKNVILMIGDGWSYATCCSVADYLTGNPYKGLVFQQDPWIQLGCSTYPIDGSYDPAVMWTDFATHRQNATDSAASATALNSGHKTKNGRIGMTPEGEPIELFSEMAKKAGFACGTVTSVGVSHATPACVAGHNISRGDGQALFHQILNSGTLDVFVGCGHPGFQEDGSPYNKAEELYQTYGPNEEDWTKIKAGDLPDGFIFIDSREDFQKIASGEMPTPKKLLGIARTKGSISSDLDGNSTAAFIPTLSEMSLAALRVLSQNEKGFYLMIEGGTIDGANHGNKIDRAVAESHMFINAVNTVCQWVEQNSSWDDTVVIITADHATGAFWGENADQPETRFATPVFNGKGNLPTGKYFARTHTNELVPMFIRGAGSEKVVPALIRGTDAKAGGFWHYDGRYIDNTDVIQIGKAALCL